MIREALGTLLILVMLPAVGQPSLEVISLRYRTAEQVLDALRPLVEPGGTLTGQGNQLIVRVSPDNLVEIRRALDAIDRPQRRLQISVRFDGSREAARRDVEVGGSINNRGAQIEGRAQGAQRSVTERIDQRVQAMDGGRATILIGENRGSAFDVVPRVSGNMVSMQILTSLAASTVSGRLGEWIELSGIDRMFARDERGIGARSESAASGSRNVWVKVEALD